MKITKNTQIHPLESIQSRGDFSHQLMSHAPKANSTSPRILSFIYENYKSPVSNGCEKIRAGL